MGLGKLRNTSAMAAFAVSLVTMPTFSFAEDVAPAATASSFPFIFTGKPCGTKENVHFCDKITSTGPSSIVVPGMKLKYRNVGRALVTWTGSVYCSVPDELGQDGPSKTSRREFFVHLALKNDNSTDIDYNGDGNATIGELNDLWVSTSYALDRNVRIWPVTLTKTFNINKPQTSNYQVLIKRDFRREHFSKNGFCNINGGSMTVTFTPRN